MSSFERYREKKEASMHGDNRDMLNYQQINAQRNHLSQNLQANE